MTIWDGILQGIIQGLTEFLPVSSSGHLGLYQHFMGLTSDSSMFFNLMLHVGTLLAVIAAYSNILWGLLVEFCCMVRDIFTRKFTFKTDNSRRRMIYMLALGTLPLLAVLPFRNFAASIAQDNDILVEGFSFLFTSMILFAACRIRPGHATVDKMRPKQALTVGIMRGVAVIPGISRSGSTASTGMLLGFEHEFAIQFSFLLGIPAILGSTILELGDASHTGIDIDISVVIVGAVTAAVVGFLCIRLVRWLIRSNRYQFFAWYTMILGGLTVVVGTIEYMAGESIVSLFMNSFT